MKTPRREKLAGNADAGDASIHDCARVVAVSRNPTFPERMVSQNVSARPFVEQPRFQVEAMSTTPPKVRCHHLHIERAQQGFTMCVDCRRPLFPFPKNKCKSHAVYCCPECFAPEEIAEFALQRSGRYDAEED